MSSPEERVQAALDALGAALVDLAREGTQPAPAAPVELLSPRVAAERLSISRSSLYLALSSGAIASRKVGGRRVIPASEITRIAEGRDR